MYEYFYRLSEALHPTENQFVSTNKLFLTQPIYEMISLMQVRSLSSVCVWLLCTQKCFIKVCIWGLWVQLLQFVCVWSEAPGPIQLSERRAQLFTPSCPSAFERYMLPCCLVPVKSSCVSWADHHINSSTPEAARFTCGISTKCGRATCVCTARWLDLLYTDRLHSRLLPSVHCQHHSTSKVRSST